MDRYDEEKRLAAKAAVQYVQDNMTIGIGSGTTVKYFIEYLAQRIESDGLKLKAVPTSLASEALCNTYNIPLCEKDRSEAVIDLTIDGADEFDPQLNLIKGGGGALLREKVVANASKCEIIIVDSRKKVETLGDTFSLPVEVLPYAIHSVMHKLAGLKLNGSVRMRTEKEPYLTDQGNYIIDCKTGPIGDLFRLSGDLNNIAGIMEHGIFINMAHKVIEGNDGNIFIYEAHNKSISALGQKSTFAKMADKVRSCRQQGGVPVIELDLDLTTFVPRQRTLEALRFAGEKYDIPEFKTPAFDLIPGYTREAWVNFISRNRFVERYPALRWIGEKDGKDGDSVYSAFHTHFWKTELLALDTLTPGLPNYIKEMQQMGAKVVLVSGRWKEEQIAPTLEVLKKGGLEHVPLMIGNPRHDSEKPISDSEVKALHQPEIREKYGIPVIVIDDRVNNRDAIINGNPGTAMLSVGCAIPGFTYDQETAGIELKISTFID